MFSQLKERVVDWYLTRTTGIPKATRDYRDWCEETIVYRANTAEDMFRNFKYVINVNYYKMFDTWHPFGLPLVDEAQQYFWPKKPVGECAVYRILRGAVSKTDQQFYISDFLYDDDRVFVATNNHEDAVMLALKYG